MLIRCLKTIFALVSDCNVHTIMFKESLYPRILPASCTTGVLMQKVSAMSELKPVEADDEMEVTTSFVQELLYLVFWHAMELEILQLGERRAWRRTY